MPENIIFALLGLIISVVVCYGLPQGYCTSNAKFESVSFACDPEELSGIDSPWYVIPGDQELLMKRDFRDLRAVQPNEWSNSQKQEYQSEVQESTLPKSSDFYSYPADTFRATREIPGNLLHVVQPSISGTDETIKSGSTSSQNPVTTDDNDYESTIHTQTSSGSPSFQNSAGSQSFLSSSSSPSSPGSPGSLGSPNSPSFHSSSSSRMAYETYQPRNFQSPATTFQTSPYISYPGPYYYPTSMMQNYNSYQIMASGLPLALDDEDDYPDEPEYPSQRFYVVYRADITPSGMNHEKVYPISKEKIEKPVTDEELEDVIKRAIKVAKQQKKQQNTLYEKRDSEDEMQKNFRKVHEKRERLTSGLSPSDITLAPEIKHNPFNLPPEMNLKDKLEEVIMMQALRETPIMAKNNNDNSEYNDAEEDEEDIWGIKRWESRKEMEEKKETTFIADLKKENEDKLTHQQFTEDPLKEEKLKEKNIETMTGMNVATEDEFGRFKKETSKHLEAEEMEKEKSAEMDTEEESEENKGKQKQIMRIERTKTQVEPSISTASFTTKAI